jgi:excisionase family DNA binding protein
MTRVAAVDCGTNSIRLLIAERGPDGRLVELERRTDIVRLGQGVDATGEFHPDALARTFAATDGYAGLIKDAGVPVDKIDFVATSAARDAGNREAFFTGIEERLGVRPEVISGDREAELSFTGALSGMPPGVGPGPVLVMDIGGGSTELILGDRDGTILAARSLDVGSVRLTERFLGAGPPPPADLDRAAEYVDVRRRTDRLRRSRSRCGPGLGRRRRYGHHAGRGQSRAGGVRPQQGARVGDHRRGTDRPAGRPVGEDRRGDPGHPVDAPGPRRRHLRRHSDRDPGVPPGEHRPDDRQRGRHPGRDRPLPPDLIPQNTQCGGIGRSDMVVFVSDQLYSVRDVAARLGVHERTIRNYLRSGALRGTRIGKQYRIARDDVEAFAGGPVMPPEPATDPVRAEVTSVIELEPITADQRARLETLIISLPGEARPVPLRVQTMIDEDRSRMKVIATGDLGTITRFLDALEGALP